MKDYREYLIEGKKLDTYHCKKCKKEVQVRTAKHMKYGVPCPDCKGEWMQKVTRNRG